MLFHHGWGPSKTLQGPVIVHTYWSLGPPLWKVKFKHWVTGLRGLLAGTLPDHIVVPHGCTAVRKLGALWSKARHSRNAAACAEHCSISFVLQIGCFVLYCSGCTLTYMPQHYTRFLCASHRVCWCWDSGRRLDTVCYCNLWVQGAKYLQAWSEREFKLKVVKIRNMGMTWWSVNWFGSRVLCWQSFVHYCPLTTAILWCCWSNTMEYFYQFILRLVD